MTRTALETAVRAWLVLAGVVGGISNADRAVIFAHQDGVRPPMPYLLVNVIVPSVQVGEDEEFVDDADPPQRSIRGNRYATVSVNAFGETAFDWLELASFRLRAPSIKALNIAAGIAVQPISGVSDLSALRDQSTERRWVQDFRVDYVRQTSELETESVVALELIEREDTFQSDTHADRVVTTTEEI